jgi:hypothetical protein
MTFQFSSVSIREFRGREAELERHPNLFAFVVLSHLRDQQSRSAGERKRWKKELIWLLQGRRCPDRDIIALVKFIDRILVLPRRLQRRLGWEMARDPEFQGRSAMQQVWTFERVAREDGREEGLKEGKKIGKVLGKELGRELGEAIGLREAIRLGLKLRFGKSGLSLVPRIEKIQDVKRLRTLLEAIETVESIEKFAARIRGA